MNLENLKELQKKESIERLKLLQKLYKVHPNVLKEFKQDETIYYSERINNFYNGILYWISNKQEYVDAVKEIENKYNIYVYHCLLSHTEFGDWLSMLFVSSTPDKWAEEKSKFPPQEPRLTASLLPCAEQARTTLKTSTWRFPETH